MARLGNTQGQSPQLAQWPGGLGDPNHLLERSFKKRLTNSCLADIPIAQKGEDAIITERRHWS